MSQMAQIQANKTIADYDYEGIRIKMRGDKTLLALKISPDILRQSDRSKLEEILRESINRARLQADYKAAGVYSGLIGMSEILADMPTLPEGKEVDARFMVVPELVAGIRDLLKKKGWKKQDLAEHSGVDQALIEELLLGVYSPYEGMKGHKTLAGAMDIAAPLARALGVSPEKLWHLGRRRLEADERMKRRQIKRMLKGFQRRSLRNNKRAPRPKMVLGTLTQTGLVTETELDLIIREENLIEQLRSGQRWMSWADRGKVDKSDLGPLLGPNGEVLRDAISQAEFKELIELDTKAFLDPESVTEAELEWARSMLGLPQLKVRMAV